MEFDLSFDSVYNWGDPVIGVNRTYMSSNIGKGVWSNTQGYSNPRVDEILDEAAQENDPEKREELIAEAYTILNEEVSHVPLHQQGLAWGKSSGVDLVQRADNQLMFYHVKK